MKLATERFRTAMVALLLLSVALGTSVSGTAKPALRLMRGVRRTRLHPEAMRRTIGSEEVMRMADSSMNIDAPSTSVA